MSTVATLQIKIGADWSEAKKAFADMQTAVKPIADQMQAVGRTMTKYVTLPLIALGGAAAVSASKLESSFAKIEGLVGVPREELQGMEKDLLKLAPATGIGPQALADALFFVTSAGFRGAEAMSVLEMSAKASAAGMGETATIADAVTSAVNAYGIENLSAAKATDILAAAVREGKLEASSLAPVLGNILPTAAAMGISFEDVAGLLAVFSRTGADAASGATSLLNIMSTLLSPTDEAAKLLASAGLSMGQLRDMAGEPGGLLNVMRLLSTTFEGNDEALRAIIPNIRAFRGVMNALAQEGGSVDGVMAGVANSAGVLDTAFQVVSETVDFKWNKALASSQVALLSFRDTMAGALAPVLETISKMLLSVAGFFEGLAPSTRTAIVAIAAVAAATGPLLFGLGALIKLLPILAAGWVALSGPIGLTVLAIGALATAGVMLAANWETLWPKIGQNVLKGLREIVGGLQWVAGAMAVFGLLPEEAANKVHEFGQSLDRNIAAGAARMDELTVSASATKDQFKALADTINTASVSAATFGGGGGGPAPLADRPTGPMAPMGLELLPSAGFGGLRTLSNTAITEMGQLKEALTLKRDEFSVLVDDISRVLSEGLGGAITGLADGFGQMVAGTASLGDVGKSLLTTLASLMQKLGGMLIAFGTAGLAFKDAGGFLSFLTNPFAAVAAGGLLIAAGAAIKGLLSKQSKVGGGAVGGVSSIDVNRASNIGGRGEGQPMQVQVVASTIATGELQFASDESGRRMQGWGTMMT